MAANPDYETKFDLAEKQTVVIQRLFDAPKELVYRTYTDPKMVSEWWGPCGSKVVVHQMEVRPDGPWRFVSTDKQGREFGFHGIYKEVVPNQKLTWEFEFEGMPGHVSTETVTFEDKGGKTLLTIRAVYMTEADRQGMVKAGMEWGVRQTLSRLEEALARKTAEKIFVISRTFNAPRELVFQAWTDPKHFAKWFGPKGCIVKVEKFEAKMGGTAHTSLVMPDGKALWGQLFYREVTEPERLVYITTFSDEKGGLTRHPMSATWPLEMLTTVTFEDEGGKTKLTVEWVPLHASGEEMKTFVAAMEGMKGGWGGSFDQLDAYLAEVQKKG